MKSFRWTFIFMAVIAALVAFTYWDYQRSQKETESEEEARNVVRLPTDQLAKIEILKRGPTLTLEKKENQWFLTEPIQDLADQQVVATLLLSFRNEKSLEIVAEGSEITSLEAFGLTEPVTRLKLTTTNGRVSELKIGGRAYDANLYAQIDEEPKVLLIGYSWDSHLAKSVKDLRDKHLLRRDLKIGDVKRIALKFGGMGPGAWSYELRKSGDQWTATGKETEFPAETDKVNFYLDAVKGVRAQDFVALEKPSSVKSVFELWLYSDEAKEPAFKARFTTPSESGNLKAVSSDYSEVLLLTKAMLDSVKKLPENFYDRKAAFDFISADVAKIEVDAGDLKGSFEKKEGRWVSSNPDLQKEVDSAKLDQAIARIRGYEAIRVLGKNQGPPQKNESTLKLYKQTGELLFEMGWGAIVVEKAKANRPEARYLPVRTNRAQNLLGLPEAEIKALDLMNWLKPVSVTPTPTPSSQAGRVENWKGNSDVRNPSEVSDARRSGGRNSRLLASLPLSE